MKMLRTLVAALLLAAVAWMAGAREKVIASDGNCYAAISIDEFTDETTHAGLVCSEFVMGVSDNGPYLLFYDRGREWYVPDDATQVETIFRIDDRPPVTLVTTWSAKREMADSGYLDMQLATEMMNALHTAETLIFRIGPNGDIRRVSFPEAGLERLFAEMADYIDEFVEANRENWS